MDLILSNKNGSLKKEKKLKTKQLYTNLYLTKQSLK